jgi:hypothetical protein
MVHTRLKPPLVEAELSQRPLGPSISAFRQSPSSLIVLLMNKWLCMYLCVCIYTCIYAYLPSDWVEPSHIPNMNICMSGYLYVIINKCVQTYMHINTCMHVKTFMNMYT